MPNHPRHAHRNAPGPLAGPFAAATRVGRALLCSCVAVVLSFVTARGQTINDIARLGHEGETVLRGAGLVVGLPGTGDPGKELVVARPLAQFLNNNGIYVDSIDELAKGRSAALVSLEVRVPAGGSPENDTLDVYVSVMHSASSLRGGRLLLSPLSGPLPGQGVYAFASGPIVLDEAITPTSGRVRGGAQLVRPIDMPAIGSSFTLVLKPPFAGWSSASKVAETIQGNYYTGVRDPARIATALDDRTIRVDVPETERGDVAGFVGLVLSYPVNASLLKLPARVVVNQATGTVILTADVTISPVGILDQDLVITTTTPPPVPTPENPLVEQRRIAPLQTAGALKSSKARLEDLLAAFRSLNVPVQKQIHILQMLYKAGQLHAELIVD